MNSTGYVLLNGRMIMYHEMCIRINFLNTWHYFM